MASSPDEIPQRYRNRPLVVMAENYILDCIGELKPAEQAAIEKLVLHAFDNPVDWRQTLREQLHLDVETDEQLRNLWLENQAIAREHETELTAIRFARLIVDDNFPELLDDTLAEEALGDDEADEHSHH